MKAGLTKEQNRSEQQTQKDVEIEDTKLIGGSRFGAIGLFRPAHDPGDTRFDPFTWSECATDLHTM